jgi:hypothetical protein
MFQAIPLFMMTAGRGEDAPLRLRLVEACCGERRATDAREGFPLGCPLSATVWSTCIAGSSPERTIWVLGLFLSSTIRRCSSSPARTKPRGRSFGGSNSWHALASERERSLDR